MLHFAQMMDVCVLKMIHTLLHVPFPEPRRGSGTGNAESESLSLLLLPFGACSLLTCVVVVCEFAFLSRSRLPFGRSLLSSARLPATRPRPRLAAGWWLPQISLLPTPHSSHCHWIGLDAASKSIKPTNWQPASSIVFMSASDVCACCSFV